MSTACGDVSDVLKAIKAGATDLCFEEAVENEKLLPHFIPSIACATLTR